MTAVVTEIHGERDLQGDEADSNKDTSSIGYMVYDETDEYVAYAAVQAAAPAMAGALIRNTIKLKHIEIGIWEATVSYVAPEKQKKDPDIGEIEWDFDTTGGTQHITSSFKTNYDFHDPGWNPMEFQNAIDVSKKKHGYEVKGLDIVVPKLELTCTTSFAPNVVTIDWIKAIAELTGKTNDAVWKTFEAGELLFMGARIKAKYREKTTVTFTFSASENIVAADNVMVGQVGGAGGFGPILKTGHQYQWIYFVQDVEAAQVLMKAKQALIETVYREADFTELGLGN